MTATPRASETPSSHPDELTLAGFAEGRLLDFEREAVELHLADCRACRELVGAAAPEDEARAAPATAQQAPAASPPARPGRRWLFPGALAAAAAALLAFLLLWEPEEGAAPGRVELALAEEAQDLFGPMRDTAHELEEFHVGVRLELSAWIRLVAIDERGEPHTMPLDLDGHESARFDGDADHRFGPYPTRFDAGRRLRAVVAVVSLQELPESRLEDAPWELVLDEDGSETLSRALGAQVRVGRLR